MLILVDCATCSDEDRPRAAFVTRSVYSSMGVLATTARDGTKIRGYRRVLAAFCRQAEMVLAPRGRREGGDPARRCQLPRPCPVILAPQGGVQVCRRPTAPHASARARLPTAAAPAAPQA